MEKSYLFRRNSELRELLNVIRYEIQKAQGIPEEVILSQEDIIQMLNISKRKLDQMRADALILFS